MRGPGPSSGRSFLSPWACNPAVLGMSFPQAWEPLPVSRLRPTDELFCPGNSSQSQRLCSYSQSLVGAVTSLWVPRCVSDDLSFLLFWGPISISSPAPQEGMESLPPLRVTGSLAQMGGNGHCMALSFVGFSRTRWRSFFVKEMQIEPPLTGAGCHSRHRLLCGWDAAEEAAHPPQRWAAQWVVLRVGLRRPSLERRTLPSLSFSGCLRTCYS